MRGARNCNASPQLCHQHFRIRSIISMCVGRSRTLAAMSRAQHRKKVDLWQQERQRCYGNMSTRASSSDADVTSSSLSEVAALDKLIDLLRGANGQQQLTQLVAENLLAFDQKFWIRLATRSDAAQSSAEKESLTNLANVRFHASSLRTACINRCVSLSPPLLHAICPA